MHPVIQHIKERQGKSVPVDDGRKIALVLFGGLMTGIRGAAAMIVLEELGLAHAFDYIYCASAGFLNASYLLSGGTRAGTSLYYKEATTKKFLNFWRLWNIADIDYLIDDIVKEKKQINVDNIWNSKTKVFLRTHNQKKDRAKYIEIHKFDKSEFWNIAKAAISIPFAHPGGARLKKLHLRDGEFLDRDHVEEIDYSLASPATDILVIYNKPGQKLVNIPLGTLLDVEHWDRVCEIYPDKDWKLSKFERDPEKLKEACEQMGSRVSQIFGGGEFKLL